MTDIQENKHTRNRTVDKFLDDHAAVISSIADFVSRAAALKSKIAEVEALRKIQEEPVTGPASDKGNAEDKAIADAMVLVSIMKGKSQMNNDQTLFQSVNYTSSKLDGLRDTTLQTTLENLNQVASDKLDTHWKDSGMSSTMIAQSVSSTTAYTALISAPRLKIDVRSSATQMIEPKLSEADLIISNIKNLGGQFTSSNPDFRNQLLAACEIINLGKNTSDNPPPAPAQPGS